MALPTTPTRYLKRDRPKAREPKSSSPYMVEGWTVTAHNSRSVYVRHPAIVGELSYSIELFNERFEIVEKE